MHRIRMKKYRPYKSEVGKLHGISQIGIFMQKNRAKKWAANVTEFSPFGEKLYLSNLGSA